MALVIGLWSLELKPGKEQVVIPQADIKITNIALGDVLSDESGRTTVKFTYQSASQPDTDDEDEDENVLESLSTAVLCSLNPGTFEQTTTDIVLQEDDKYTFQVVGKNTVYLTGNYIEQQSINNPPFDMDSDDDMESELEDAYDLREVSSDVEMHPDDLSDASRFEDVTEEPPKSLKRAREADGESLKPADKKKKLKGDGGVAAPAPEADQEKEKKAKKTEKKEKKKKEQSKEKEGEKPEVGVEQKSVEREIAGGIKILDSKIGTGPMAKKGNKVRMRYIGKLSNGKVFDKNVKGSPFTFHLGKGEVIKGWDEGIVGMQVGGERKLTIPPSMGYGKEGSGAIPKNATLIFECKLMEIR